MLRNSGFVALAVFCSLTGFSIPGVAQTPTPVAATSDQALQSPAGKFIQDLGDKAIGIITDKSLTLEQRNAKYTDLLTSAFDIPTIGHFVFGRSWNTATPAQQQQFLKLFQGLMVKIYGDRLSFFSGESFKVKAVRPESDKDSVVNSEVGHPQGTPPTPIDWRVRQSNGDLKVVDVVIEGVSQSVTQRQEYASILEHNNNNIDALLKLMQDRLRNPQPVDPQPSSTP